MKNDMSNMNDCDDEIETNMHDHEIHSTKRTDVVDQMLNEINYRVLEINSLAVFLKKTTDHDRIGQSWINREHWGRWHHFWRWKWCLCGSLGSANKIDPKETDIQQNKQNVQPQAWLRRKSNNLFLKKKRSTSMKQSKVN